jgi:hypothetical protein
VTAFTQFYGRGPDVGPLLQFRGLAGEPSHPGIAKASAGASAKAGN